MRLSEAKGWQTSHVSAVSPQNSVLLSYFDSFLPPTGKRSKLKAFLEVTLVQLKLRALTLF